MSIIWFLIVGLLAGLIARAVVPGRQSMGLLATMLLGVVGSFLGGFIGSLISREAIGGRLRPAGLIMSIVGAIVVLLAVSWVGRRRVTA